MKPLDHKKIEREEIIERYVMRQLTEEEREAFEEHLFSCDECFEKVKLTEKVISGIREAAKQGALKEKQRSPLRLFWERIEQFLTQPAVAIAAAVLTLILLYPAVKGIWLRQQMEALRTPRIIGYSFTLEQTPRRSVENILQGKTSSETIIKIPDQAEFFTLTFTILESSIPNPTYRAEILNRQNKVIWKTERLKSVGEFAIFSILCPRSFFENGAYVLKVEELDSHGTPTGKVHLFPFEIVQE